MNETYLARVKTWGPAKSSPPHSSEIGDHIHLVRATRRSLAEEKVISKYSALVDAGLYIKFEVEICENIF